MPSAVAEEYQERFAEVMVDEYQDSNLVQETILTSVSGMSKGRNNMFMVGDVKQSIYRFRLSRPNFLWRSMILTVWKAVPVRELIFIKISEAGRKYWTVQTIFLKS